MQQILQVEKMDGRLLQSKFDGLFDEIKRLSKHLQPKEPTKYLSRKEVAEMLGVTLVTISDWTKKGILQSYKIGNRVFYKRHEIETSLIKVKNPMIHE